MGMITRTELRKNRPESAILGLCGLLILAGLLSGSGFLEKGSVPDLLKKRAEIIQLVWYSELTPEEGEQMLNEIETHPLLAEDVAWLRAAEEGMGFAYVMDMEVLDLHQTSRSLKGTCYRADIRWELEEYNRHVTETYHYRIRTVISTDGHVRLSEFTVL